MKVRKYSSGFASDEPINAVRKFEDGRASLPSRSDPSDDKVPRKKSSKRRSKCCHSKRNNKGGKGH